MMQTRDPKSKARDLLARYGTPDVARAFAWDCMKQHEPGSPSQSFWSHVLRELRRAPGALGRPHTRAQRRKLREGQHHAGE